MPFMQPEGNNLRLYRSDRCAGRVGVITSTGKTAADKKTLSNTCDLVPYEEKTTWN